MPCLQVAGKEAMAQKVSWVSQPRASILTPTHGLAELMNLEQVSNLQLCIFIWISHPIHGATLRCHLTTQLHFLICKMQLAVQSNIPFLETCGSRLLVCGIFSSR